MRAIFQAPAPYKQFFAHPLAYIEWFTSFSVRDKVVGMYQVAPSTDRGYRCVTIVPITDIVRTCHLIPVWGEFMDRSMDKDHVLDQASKFYVNPYLRHSDFVILRMLVDRYLIKRHGHPGIRFPG